MKELKDEEKIEIVKVIAMILLIIIIMIGLAVDKTSAKTIDVMNTSVIQNGSYTELKRCTDSQMCTVYGKNDVRTVNASFRHAIEAGKKYKITTTIGYVFGNRYVSRNPNLNYVADKYIFLYSTSGQEQRLTCEKDTITNYIVENGDLGFENESGTGYDSLSSYVQFDREISCEFTANIDAIVVGTSLRTTSEGFDFGGAILLDYFTISGNETAIDIIDNANKNQQQTNERLDNIDNHLKDILTGEEYVKPEKNEDIENMENEEQEIFDLFEYDPDSVTINIDDTSTRKIFELLSRIITQNSLIQAMVITILSISIIKLVLGR